MMSSFSTRYDSTRGEDTGRTLGEAIETGLANDGGLFLPQSIPAINPASLESGSFLDLSMQIMQHWLGETEFAASWVNILSDALSFPVPMVPLDEDLVVCELFHGPTLSFKDFGARTMARLLGDRLSRTGQERIILVATSGDTGSAVADGFAGIEGINVVLLYPAGGVSEVQERQLVVRRPGVHSFRISGSFDDCQKLVKSAFHHDAFRDLPLSTANSINIARLLPQMLYYWWAVMNMMRSGHSPESHRGTKAPMICVPSGNLGNLTAGILAHLSGMPVAGFHAAHNANDFFVRYLRDGTASTSASVKTLSNAMDVGAPSNFERLEKLLPGKAMSRLLSAGTTDDEETLISMQRVHERTGYLADPHTAVGIHSIVKAREKGRAGGPVVVMSTAHPAKFPDTCAKAIGTVAEEPERLAVLKTAKQEVTEMDTDIHALADAVRKRTGH